MAEIHLLPDPPLDFNPDFGGVARTMNLFLPGRAKERWAAMDLAPQDRQLTGRLVAGRWRVGALLGVGGMSSVYEAVHRNGKRVAIKILHPTFSNNSRARARFLREGYIANKIAHRGIASVLDDGVTDDGLLFLVMELLAGATLEQHCRARGGRLPETEMLVIAGEVLDVLAAAHAHGVVHRDIKASNVFLTTDGIVKLLDFGAARLRETAAAPGDTRSGAVLGTPGFMAPEQARGRWDEVDARTDIWSVGATMFRLVTGRLVHKADTPNEAIIAAATSHAPSLASIDPSLALSAGIIDSALSLAPRDRWSSAREMRDAIRNALACRPECPLPRPVVPSDGPVTLDEAVPSGAAGVRPTSVLGATRQPRSLLRRRLFTLAVIGGLGLVSTSAIRLRRGRASTDEQVVGRPVSAATPLPHTTQARAQAAAPADPAAPRMARLTPAPAAHAALLSSPPRPRRRLPAPMITPPTARDDDAADPTSKQAQSSQLPPTRLEDVLDERK